MQQYILKHIIFSVLLLFVAAICFAESPEGAPKESSANTAGIDLNKGITIDEAVEEGIRSNLELLAAKYDVSIARADELTAGLWYNPSITIDGLAQTFGSNWNQTTAGGPKQNDAVLSYPLDITNKRGKRKESAHQAYKAAEANFQDIIRKKVLEIRLSYINVMLNEELLKLSHEKESNMQKLVELLKTRVGSKDILPLLQSRAQLALDQAAQARKKRENNLIASKNSLVSLLASSSFDVDFEIKTKLRDFSVQDLPDKEKIVNDALQTRPDIQELKINYLKAVSDRKLASAMTLDNLGLSLGYTSYSGMDANPNTGAPALNGTSAWSASLNIPLPLFDRNQWNKEKANLLMEQILKQAKALELSIRQEITNLYDHVSLTKELIVKYENVQLKNAEYVRDTQQRLFGTGAQQQGLLEYFDSIGAYNDTLEDYYNSLADYRKDIASLNAALGRDLWQ